MNGEKLYEFQRSGVGLELFLRALEERRDAFQRLGCGGGRSPPDGRASGVSGKGRSVSLGVEGGHGANGKRGVGTQGSRSGDEASVDGGVSKKRGTKAAGEGRENDVVDWKRRKVEEARRKEARRRRVEERLRERQEALEAKERERVALRRGLEARLNEARKGLIEANERIALLKKRKDEVVQVKHNLVQELKQVGVE